MASHPATTALWRPTGPAELELVRRFEVETAFLTWYPIRQVGGQTILELWVPAEDLDDFNAISSVRSR